jgi:NADPH:quinone reductase-like Zn-dependent oxidoreductase
VRAAVNTVYGPPEVIQVIEVPKPVPAGNEILIRVHASTVNRTDYAFFSGKPFINRLFGGLFKPRNKTLGNEFAGEVEVVGSAVTSFKPGDRVFGYNDRKFGGHAEYVIMKEDSSVTGMPVNASFTEASCITEGAHYALSGLKAAKVGQGQKVLIYGATGAIGSAALQLSKYFGAEVTAVCDTKNVELIRSLGADRVIDYTREDFTKTGQEFDLVFDAVGKISFGKSKAVLKERGIYMSSELGKRSENIFLALITPLRAGKKVLFPIPSISKEIVNFLKELVESGHYKPVIDRHYSLDQIVDAYKYVGTGQKTGNVIITISS